MLDQLNQYFHLLQKGEEYALKMKKFVPRDSDQYLTVYHNLLYWIQRECLVFFLQLLHNHFKQISVCHTDFLYVCVLNFMCSK